MFENENKKTILEVIEENDKEEYKQKLKTEIFDNTKQPTLFWCLGGIDEIGKNMYVFQQSDEIFIVDCGIKFAEEDLPGIAGIICPFEELKEQADKIKGLLITHGHEDHIGGIPYLLMSIEHPFPIYGGKLTLELIKKRLSEFPEIKVPELIEIDDSTIIKTDEFKIEFFRVCHSIPDAFGIYLETKNARIVESGDFKFDFSTNGDEFDMAKVSEFARRDVDLLLCESTNAETKGFAASEKEVIDELKNIIENAPSRVFVSTFASNLQRIEEVILLAIKNNRKICMFGRSMNTNINIAINTGLLNVSKEAFIDSSELNNFPNNEILVLCTGSQGEEMAALNQMAIGRNPKVVLEPSDTIILSSNPIPGNFESVEQLVNRLYMKNVHVETNSKESKLHSSGHATQMEQQLLFKLVNPQYIIPIHGEYKMLRALKQNAVDSAIHPDNIFQVARGQIVEIYNHKLKVTQDFFDIYDVYVNNGKIDDDSTATLKYRKILSRDGIFNVTLLINYNTKKLVALPSISTRGTFFIRESHKLLTKISYSIKERVSSYLARCKTINNSTIRHLVSNTASFYIWSNKRKRPIVRTTIFELNKKIQPQLKN